MSCVHNAGQDVSIHPVFGF